MRYLQKMIKNGAEVIHLATGMVVGYPPCPRGSAFKKFIESYYNIPVVIGTHPIPMKYFKAHSKLDFWDKTNMFKIASNLMNESEEIMLSYD